MNNRQNTPTIAPTCSCCLPTQKLVVTDQRTYCPLTQRLYDNNGNQLPAVIDFYPAQRPKGEKAPFAINPAEERFGSK
jgi:hypothetical protein